MNLRHSAFFCIMSLLAAGCNSLLNETDRIRRLYEEKNGGSPTVTATDPADNSIAPYNQTYIDVTFSTNIDAGSFTAQTQFGACNGSFQVSYDGFMNCLGGSVDTSGNPRIRFTPNVFPRGLGLQIRVSNSVLSAIGVAATGYTSPVGFRLGAPCGSYNCFFSHSTPLMSNAGGYSGIFLVRGGANAGKYLVYTAGITTTTLIDPANASSSAGPDMAAGGCSAPGTSTHNFLNNAGTKEVIIRGNSTTNTCLFDHSLNTFATGPNFAGATGLGSYSFKPQNPLSSEYGNTLITCANNSAGVVRFASNDTATGTVYSLSGGNANLGAHAIRATAGGYAGKWLNFNSGTFVTLFTENPPAMTTSATYNPGAVGNGAVSFEVFAGPRTGQVLTVFGAGSTLIFAYDLNADAAAASQPAAMPAAVNGGAMLLRQPGTTTYDYPVIVHGSSAMFGTSIYNSTTGNFGSGPSTTGAIGGGSAQIYIAGGAYGGGFLIANGAASASTSVFIPSLNAFHGSRMPTSVPNQGATAFQILSGSLTGKTLITSGNARTDSAVYDPIKHEMSVGPSTLNNGTTSSFSIPLTQGNHTGKVLVFIGGNTATVNAYNPSSNTFTSTLSSPALPVFNNMGTGGTAFPVANSSQIILVRGNSTTSSDILDQSTMGLSGPLISPCSVQSEPLTLQFKKISTGQVRQLVFCQSNQMAIFDHGTVNYVTTANLSGVAGTGARAYVIPSGPNAGKVLVIHGNSTSATSILDPETNLAAAGPDIIGTAPGCSTGTVGAGAQLLPLTSGFNAGKALLLVGGVGGSVATCLYDPQSNSFSNGPAVSATASPGFQIGTGSLAFRTNGGLYPTSYIVMSGANKNVWSTYVP